MHERTIRWIANYFIGTSTHLDLPDRKWQFTTRGIVHKPNIEKCIECYVYPKTFGGWAQADSNSLENVIFHTRYVRTYVGFSVLWCSKLQMEISLSMAEVEYIAWWQVMHNVTLFMTLIKKVSFIFDINIPKS